MKYNRLNLKKRACRVVKANFIAKNNTFKFIINKFSPYKRSNNLTPNRGHNNILDGIKETRFTVAPAKDINYFLLALTLDKNLPSDTD